MSRAGTRPTNPTALRAVSTGPPKAPPVHVGELWAMGEDRLVRLLAVRPDLAVPPPVSWDELHERSQSLDSVHRALTGADVLVLQLAQVLTIVGETHAPLDAVRQMVGDVPEVDIQRGLSWLEERHLVSRLPGSEICVHLGLLSIAGAGGLGPPAAPLVEARTVTDLRSILTMTGWKSTATRKADLVAAVLAFVSDPAGVQALVAGAPPGVRDYARRAAESSTSIRLPWDGASNPYRPAPNAATTAPVWLLQRGLAYKDTWYTAIMPREVGLALRGGRPFPAPSYRRPPVALEPLTAPAPFAAESRVAAAVQATERLIDAWGSKPAALLKQGGVGVREVRRLAGDIDVVEREAFRLVEMAVAAGLIVADTRQGLAMPTSAADEWLDLGTAERWWALALSWLETPMYPSLAGLVDTRKKNVPALGYPAHFDSEAPGQRRAILQALLGLPENMGASDDALAEAVVWDAPMLWGGGPTHPSMLVGWAKAEMELLGLMVGGAPTPLASALVAGDLEAVRSLTGPPSEEWQMVLQGDLTALATGQVPSAVRAELEVLADVEARGSATVYRFSEGSVRRAFDAGHSAEAILAFLEEHAAKGVPQPLAYLVGDVERRHGQVRVGHGGCYIRFEDAALAAEVARASRTAKLGLRQIAPTVLVCDQPHDAVLKTLRTAGYLPVAESRDGSVVHTPVGRHRAEIPRAHGPSGPSRSKRPGGSSADRWRSELSIGGAAGRGTGVADARELVAALARTAPGTLPDSTRHPHRRGQGSGREPMVEIPTLLRRPSWDAPDPVGQRADLEILAGLLGEPIWEQEGDDREAIQELLGFDIDDREAEDWDGDAEDRDEEGDDAERERPTAIFHARGEILELLASAEEEEWLVRLSYTSAAGKPSEVTVLVLGISGSVLLGQAAPRWTTQKYVVDRISWARALTAAEEDKVL